MEILHKASAPSANGNDNTPEKVETLPQTLARRAANFTNSIAERFRAWREASAALPLPEDARPRFLVERLEDNVVIATAPVASFGRGLPIACSPNSVAGAYHIIFNLEEPDKCDSLLVHITSLNSTMVELLHRRAIALYAMCKTAGVTYPEMHACHLLYEKCKEEKISARLM